MTIPSSIKFRKLLVLSILLITGLAALCDDYYLLPQNFFMHKGQTLNLHLLLAEMFDKEKEIKYRPAETTKLALYEGSKVIDLKSNTSDTAHTLLSYKVQAPGAHLIELTQNLGVIDLDRGAFIRELDQEGLVKLSEKANASFQQDIKEKYTEYLKTLFTVDKPGGSVFNKELGHELEIILLQNPYKADYGDDVTAVVKFKGKPLLNAHVDLLVKTSTGKVYAERLSSDATGNCFFKLSREGSYLLRTVNIEAVKAKDYDYQKWAAAYTFGFSNTSKIPNDY